VSRMNTVLLATNNKSLREQLTLPIRSANLSVMTVSDADLLIPIVEKDSPDLLLLDTDLAEDRTEAILTELQESADQQVMLLTDRADPKKLRPLLRHNIDDFILSNASADEITLRLQAHFAKADAAETPGYTLIEDKISALGLVLDRTRRTLTDDGKNIDLTTTEFRILELLMTNPDYTFSRKEIYELVWNSVYMDDDSKIMMHISNLRNKIGDKPGGKFRIVTVKGKGYKFASPSDQQE